MILNKARKRCFGMALGGLGVLAQGSPGTLVTEQIYAKLATAFSAPTSLGSGTSLLLLAQPGIAISAQQLQDPAELSRLMDRIPLPTGNYSPSSSTYSSVYSSILRTSQGSRNANQNELSRIHELKLVFRDRRHPWLPSGQYAAYLKYKTNHAKAVDAQAVARTEQKASGKQLPMGLEAAVAQALRDWESLGFKALIDDSVMKLRRSYDSNVQVLLAEQDLVLHNLAHADQQPTPWYPVQATPPFKDWLDGNGWQNWSFQKRDHQPQLPPGQLPLVFPAGATLSSTETKWLESLTLAAQLKRVDITRPWLDTSLFFSHSWSLPKSSPFARVSSGRPQDPEPGIMPLLVTGVLLARNLVLSGPWDEPVGQREAPKAVGPFALANPPRAGLLLHPFVSNGGGTLSVRVDGAQIIGFFCEPIPLSPTPDPTSLR